MLNRSICAGQRAVIVSLAGLMLLVILVRFHRQNRALSPPSPASVIVDIQGDVRHPGIHLLKGKNLTVADALKAAGGLQASGSSMSLSRESAEATVQTGQRLRFIRQNTGEIKAVMESMDAASHLVVGGKLDVNSASQTELCLVPQMKPQWAEAIVQRRGSQPWRNLEEIEVVPGIGSKTLQKWSEYLEVGERPPAP